MKDYERLISCAQGKEKADTVFKNGRVVDVFSGRIREADVAVCGGYIAGVGKYSGLSEIDLGGAFLCPGFIDAHMHFESAMSRPEKTVRLCAESGTLCFIADPHEAANVCGAAGIGYMLEHTEDVPADVYIMIPSCVPSLPTERSGAVIEARDMDRYLSEPRVLGLAEMMNCPGVLALDPAVLAKIRLFRGRPVDGHIGEMPDPQIAGLAAAGICSDHECCDFESALRQISAGMYVHIRQGSAARNLRDIVTGIVASGVDTSRFCFCTDDKDVEQIVSSGHIVENLRESVELGLDPVDAVRMASLNAACCYGLNDIGAIAPGRKANFVAVSDLKGFEVRDVYYMGVSVRDWDCGAPRPVDESLKKTVNIKEFSDSALEMKVGGGLSPVIELLPGQILTKLVYARLPEKDGLFVPGGGYSKAAIFERHHATGKIGLAAVRGFGIRGGAAATTVAHDSHNLLCIGDNDRDMLTAVRELIRLGGGCCLAENGAPVCTLPLPIMGLMSESEPEEVARLASEFKEKARKAGVGENIDPLMTMSFLSLPVIPQARITPDGVFDSLKMELI